MCGIVGIYSKNNSKKIKEFLKPITHRGSSNFEYKIFDDFSIGCNRLPIIDENFGDQPFTTDDENISCVLNGEIFNHKQLKLELTKLGYKLKTNCDTEVILYLYKKFGLDFVNKIDSEMFAIIIYDKMKNKLIVARDKLGVKPLYYSKNNSDFYFASEIKQLSKFDFIEKIEEFPKGNIFDGENFMEYFNLENFSKNIEKFQINKAKLVKILEKAVEKRIDFKDKIGVLYSGGIDSTIILNFAKKYHKNITAYICGNEISTDRKFAQKYCEENKIHYKIIEPKSIEENDLKKLVKICETTDFNIIGHSWVNYLVYQKMKKDNIKVALCGEGADELFGGYNEFTKINFKNFQKAKLLLLNNLNKTQLQRVDRTSMNFTIETRSPFLDSDLIEYVLNLDSKNKLFFNQFISKYLLRESFREIIPNYIIDRKKMPFSSGAGFGVNDKEIKKNEFENLDYKNIIENEFKVLKYNKFKQSIPINKNNILSYL